MSTKSKTFLSFSQIFIAIRWSLDFIQPAHFVIIHMNVFAYMYSYTCSCVKHISILVFICAFTSIKGISQTFPSHFRSTRTLYIAPAMTVWSNVNNFDIKKIPLYDFFLPFKQKMNLHTWKFRFLLSLDAFTIFFVVFSHKLSK